jgi:teichoic acid transport system ATP-binding protein
VFFQAKCYHKFEEFKKLGKTILFVSHDLSSISKYCDRVVLLNKGTKLGEGTSKEMIDIYKRVLVGQYMLPENSQEKSLLDDEEIRDKAAGNVAGTTGTDKSATLNPDTLEYGTKNAVITECFMTDHHGMRTTAVVKGQEYTIHMLVRFQMNCPAPIFAYTIKNIRGTEITGTNTMIERAFLEPVEAGTVKEITFRQRMMIQGGEYLISFGVTGYEAENFTVYHRLYDAINLTVISDKDTVGYYDSESKIKVETVKHEKSADKIVQYRADA